MTRRWQPRNDRERRMAEAFERFHWGDEPDGTRRLAVPVIEPGGVQLYALGDIVEITYAARKGGEKLAWWEHAFEAPFPVLASTEAGRLVICGGGYRVTRRGIVG